MDLDITSLRTVGRARRVVAAEVLRPLDTADLALLAEERGTQAPPLKRIGERHHALARNLASGMAPGEAAIVCGLSLNRVSILQSDPAFKELVEFYRRDVDATYRGLHERLFGLAMDATEELATRLEEKPEELSVGQLMEVVKMGADRTGHGPQATTTNFNVNVDLAKRLEEARKRVAERRMKTIEGDTE